jgi:hypothetical protein
MENRLAAAPIEGEEPRPVVQMLLMQTSQQILVL